MCHIIIILNSVFTPIKAVRFISNVTWSNNNFNLSSHLPTYNIQHIYIAYCIAPQIIQKFFFSKTNLFFNSAEVKNVWSYTSIPPDAVTKRCLINHGDKFTFIILYQQYSN